MSRTIKKKSSEILRINQSRTSPLSAHFLLVAHNIRSLHNVGALFRSSDAFGVRELILSGYTPSPPDPSIRKTALGADAVVPWSHCGDSLPEKISEWKQDDYKIYALEQTWTSELLHLHKPKTDRVCLILGNEITGIDDVLLPLIDHFVEIPQYGEKHSLNVSVAAGVSLYSFLQKWTNPS